MPGLPPGAPSCSQGKPEAEARPRGDDRPLPRPRAPEALFDLGEAQLKRGDRAAAAATFDRLDREHPASDAARGPPRADGPRPAPPARSRPAARAAAAPRQGRGAPRRPAQPGRPRYPAGGRPGACPAAEVDRARVRLGRALAGPRSATDGRARSSRRSRPALPLAAEAAWHLARDRARRRQDGGAVHGDGRRLPRDAVGRDAPCAPPQPLPEGRPRRGGGALLAAPARRSTRTAATRRARPGAWAGATTGPALRRAARRLGDDGPAAPPGSATPGFLYWAARAHLALGRARTAPARSSRRPSSASSTPTTGCAPSSSSHGSAWRLPRARRPAPAAGGRCRPARRTRVTLRELLLIDHFDEAARELRLMGSSARVLATLGWVEWRRAASGRPSTS